MKRCSNKNIIARGFRKIQRIAGLETKKRSVSTYTNYNDWIRSPQVSMALIDLLDRKTACYSKYTNEDYYTQYLLPHLQKPAVNHSVKILRAATFEVYIRYVQDCFDRTG